MDLARRKPSPVTGVELVEIAFKTSFFPDKEVGIAMLEDLAEEMGAWPTQARAQPAPSSAYSADRRSCGPRFAQGGAPH